MRIGRRLLGAVVAWGALVVVLRLFVLAPEQCEPPEPAEIDRAAELAVTWFERNQLDSGRLVYAFDRDAGEADEGIHLVRHHGVLLSLYQAANGGIGRAQGIADDALDWSLGRLVTTAPRAQAVGFEGAPASTGASALFVAALVERRALTGDDRYDDVARMVGRFLLGQVEPTGAVVARWDPGSGPATGVYSVFFTGETMWALGRLAEIDPDGPWLAAAERISAYLATDRDRAERRLPFFGDHWGSYGLETLDRLSGPLPDAEADHARRLAGLLAVRTRLESQNPDRGPIRLTRGAHSLAAGVGTLGEGMQALHALASRDDRLADLEEPLRDHLACVAGLLVERQVTADEIDPGEPAERIEGAWFRLDRTQQDDQQHALSALVLSSRVLDGTESRARHVDHGGVGGWLTLVLALTFAADPFRASRRSHEGVRIVSSFTIVGLVAAVAADPVLDGLDLGEPTVRLAAGLAVMITALVDLFDPHRTGAAMLRPGALLVVLAGGADPGDAATVLAVGIAAGCGLLANRFGPQYDSPHWRLLTRFVAAAALLFGTDLAVDGVFEL